MEPGRKAQIATETMAFLDGLDHPPGPKDPHQLALEL
jgi:hypothetical protein